LKVEEKHFLILHYQLPTAVSCSFLLVPKSDWGYFWRPVVWLKVQKHLEENQELSLLSLYFRMMLLATACIGRPMLRKKKQQQKTTTTQTASKDKMRMLHYHSLIPRLTSVLCVARSGASVMHAKHPRLTQMK